VRSRLSLFFHSQLIFFSFVVIRDVRRLLIEKYVMYTVYDDPEFILKLALYVRTKLYIRTTANFLLALAANYRVCHSYYPRYFCATVRLPKDLIEVLTVFFFFIFKGISRSYASISH